MDYSKQLDSDWLKININVKDGEHIRFLDAGTEETDDKGNTKVVFNVGVLEGGKVKIEKLFQLNKTNGKVVADELGMETSKWVGKEFQVNKVRVRNPRTGENVDSIEIARISPNAEKKD